MNQKQPYKQIRINDEVFVVPLTLRFQKPTFKAFTRNLFLKCSHLQPLVIEKTKICKTAKCAGFKENRETETLYEFDDNDYRYLRVQFTCVRRSRRRALCACVCVCTGHDVNIRRIRARTDVAVAAAVTTGTHVTRRTRELSECVRSSGKKKNHDKII